MKMNEIADLLNEIMANRGFKLSRLEHLKISLPLNEEVL